MPLTYPDLSALDETDVQSTLDFLFQRLAEYSPTLEQKRGVIRDVVLHLESVLGQALAKTIEDVDASSSLLKIEEDPTLATDEVVDRVLSNFRITRRAAAKASGTIVIVLDSLAPVTLASDASFIAGSLTFTADEAYAARISEGAVVSSTDRLISAISEELYSFTIDVTADEAGAASQLARGTALTPVAGIPHFVRAYVESDFTGGVDAQTNTELLNILTRGMADKSPSNILTLEALLTGSEDFSNFLALSVAGYGDSEQRRYHSIFPVAFGGRVDAYVRTQALPQSIKLTKTATLIARESSSSESSLSSGGGGDWQVSITRDEAPGFYEVDKIVQADDEESASYEVTETIRGYDLTADGTFLPDITSATEAVFSRFQTATIRFVDDDTDTSTLEVNSATRSYDVYLKTMPLIKDLQTFLADRERRPAADLLVKAPVPCFVTLTFDVTKKASEASPDLAAIKTSLASYVNNTGFAGSLNGSALAHVIHEHLSATQSSGSMLMEGRVVRPDGGEDVLSDSETLTVPDDPENMVSALTVIFILEVENITINLVSV